MRRGVVLVVAGLALASYSGCWRPRANGASAGTSRAAPGWERGPQAGAEAQAGASLQFAWDGPGVPVSVVGNSTDADGQRSQSDIVTEHSLEEVVDMVTPRARPLDGGVDRLLPIAPPEGPRARCLTMGDGGLVERPCAAARPDERP